MAVQMTFKIRQTFGVDFPLQAVLQAPVLRAQAQRLEEELLAQADAIELENLVNEIEQAPDNNARPPVEHKPGVNQVGVYDRH